MTHGIRMYEGSELSRGNTQQVLRVIRVLALIVVIIIIIIPLILFSLEGRDAMCMQHRIDVALRHYENKKNKENF